MSCMEHVYDISISFLEDLRALLSCYMSTVWKRTVNMLLNIALYIPQKKVIP